MNEPEGTEPKNTGRRLFGCCPEVEVLMEDDLIKRIKQMAEYLDEVSDRRRIEGAEDWFMIYLQAVQV